MNALVTPLSRFLAQCLLPDHRLLPAFLSVSCLLHILAYPVRLGFPAAVLHRIGDLTLAPLSARFDVLPMQCYYYHVTNPSALFEQTLNIHPI